MPDEAPVQANLPLTPEPASAATPAAPPASPAPSNSVSPAQTGLLEQVKQFGFEGVTTEQEAQTRLFSDYQRMREEADRWQSERESLIEQARYGREYLESLRQPQQPSQDAPAQEPSDHPWWKVPSFDTNVADRYREVDPATGAAKWKDETPAAIRAGFDNWKAGLEQWTYDLTTRPHEILPEIIRHEAAKLFDEFYSQRVGQQSDEQFLSKFQTDNQWIWELDPRTQRPMHDPFTGQARYSDEGRRFAEIVAQFDGNEKLTQREKLSIAKQIYDAQAPKPQAVPPALQPAAQLAQTAAQKRQESARRASRAIPQRNGSEPDPTERPRPQNRNKTFGEQVVEQMRNEGALAAP